MRRGSPRIISCRKPQAGDKGLGVWDLNINQHRYPFLFFVWSHLLWTAQIQPRVHLAEGPSHCPLPSSPFSISLSLHSSLSFSILPTDEIPDSPPDSFHPHHHLSGTEQQERRDESDGRGVSEHLAALLQQHKTDMHVAHFSQLLAKQNGCQWDSAGKKSKKCQKSWWMNCFESVR